MLSPDIQKYVKKSFTNLDLTAIECNHLTFDHCDFRGVNMQDMVTRGCTFQNCNFSFAKLSGSRHRNTAFLNCQFYTADLFAAAFHDCKCMGSGFLDTVLTGITLCRGNYDYCNFQYADLQKCDLSEISFQHADFRHAKLDFAKFNGADLSHAVLSNTTIKQTDFRDANFDGVYLKDLSWRKTKIDLKQAVQLAENMGAVVLD